MPLEKRTMLAKLSDLPNSSKGESQTTREEGSTTWLVCDNGMEYAFNTSTGERDTSKDGYREPS